MVFALQKNMNNRYTEWRFPGAYQKLQFKFKYFFTFPQKIENIMGKEIPESPFRKTIKIGKVLPQVKIMISNDFW